MAYNKTVWKIGETKLSASNFNNMENGIESADKGENTIEFVSGDVENPTSAVSVELLQSGDTVKTFVKKASNMFRNVRYILKAIGNTDIQSIGEGTLTSAISFISKKMGVLEYETTTFSDVTGDYSSDFILKFNGKNISPVNFPYGVFLIMLNGSYIAGGASIYMVVLGTKNNTSNVVYNLIGEAPTGSGTYPGLMKTASGYSATFWTTTSGATSGYKATINANVLRLR